MVIAVILALIVCLVLIPTCAFAETGENGEQTEQPVQNSEKPAEEQNNNLTVTGEAKAVEEKTSTTEAGTGTEGGDNSGKTDGVVVSPAPTQTPATTTPATTENTSGNAGYTVEFTVGEKTYVLDGNTSVDLNEILGELGIDGKVTEAKSSKENLFSVAQDEESGKWTVSANNAFSTTHSLTVLVDGKPYEIVVTDDNKFVVTSKSTSVDYESLQDAINAAENGDTIILKKDVEECVVIAENKKITIDLGGYTLTNGDNAATGCKKKDTITNSGNLTITDSSTNKTGKVDNTADGCGALVNLSTGTATLNGGSFTRSKENGYSQEKSGGNSWYNIKNHGTMYINDGVTVTQDGQFSSLFVNGWWDSKSELTEPHANDREVWASGKEAALIINGGTFSGGKYNIKNDDYGFVTINNGKFSNVKTYNILNWNEAEINNGEFTANSGNIYNSYAVGGATDGKLTITGGKFSSSAKKLFTKVVEGSTIGITGGVYDDSNVKNYVADGYVVTENGGKYVVSKYVEPAPVVVPEQTTTTKKTDTIVEAKKDNATEQTNVAVEGTTAKITVTDDKGEFVAPQEVTIKSVTALESTGATEASIQLDTKLVLDLDVATIKSASTSDVVTVTNEDSVITVKSGETALVSVDVKAVLSETEQTVTVKFSENTVKVVCGDTAYDIDLSELGGVGTLTLKLENGVLKVYDKDGNLLKEIEKA